MARTLVVANQTLGGSALLAAIEERAAGDDAAAFHVLVPATPVDEYRFHAEGEAIATAEARLAEAVDRFEALGVEVTGEIGDANPLYATLDVLREGDFDAVILSTFPPGPSRWLGMDLPSRLARNVDLPVTHVIAADEPSAT